jgi:hypothetical protein
VARIQFILKNRDNQYGCDPQSGSPYLSSGLYNSARLVAEMLRCTLGFETRLDHAIDNNAIDRLVTQYKPDICVIEAYWVVPEKFAVLTKLHPRITWIVRNHSAMPFASMEGQIVDWSLRYMDYPNVIIACNEPRTDIEFRNLIALYKPTWIGALQSRCVLLPNYYPVTMNWRDFMGSAGTVNVGCFGALRPLKNQLLQAVAALEWAKSMNKKLRFHINATRVEGRADAVLQNMRRLFALMPTANLVEHPWLNNTQFLALCRTMDVGMQVSFSETFCITAADMLVSGVPIVVSSEVTWVPRALQADPTDSVDIIKGLRTAYAENFDPTYMHQAVMALQAFDADSVSRWSTLIGTIMQRNAELGR